MVSGISISGDLAAGQFHVPRAKALLNQLEQRAKLGGVTLSSMIRIDANTYCYAVVAGGVQRAVIVTSPTPEAVSAQPTGPLVTVPDFYSGVIANGYLTTDALPLLVSFHPTTACARQYGIHTGATAHLAVDGGGVASPINVDPVLALANSQYANIKATQFSSRMRGLVQVLMGFGKQLLSAGKPISKLPKAFHTPADGLPKTAYQLSVDVDGLVIGYQHRFGTTDGIGLGSDGKLWIVNLSQTNGVIAMPLPVLYGTTLPAYRGKLAGDALDVVKAFGGIPTGEPFPVSLAPWIRAGRLIQAAGDLSDFYTATGPSGTRFAYSDAIGWAFNKSGNEAHNCAVNQSNSGANFTNLSVHGKVEFAIGAQTVVTPKTRTVPMKKQFATQRGMVGDDVLDAAMWKLDRLDAGQWAEANRQLGFSVSDAITYVDGLVLAPLATLTATYTEVSAERLPETSVVVPGSMQTNVLAPELTAFTMLHQVIVRDNTFVANTTQGDATIFAYFIDDALQTVNYTTPLSAFAVESHGGTYFIPDTANFSYGYFQGTQFVDEPITVAAVAGMADPFPDHTVSFRRMSFPYFDREAFVYDTQVTTFVASMSGTGQPVADTIRSKTALFGSLAAKVTGDPSTPVVLYSTADLAVAAAMHYVQTLDFESFNIFTHSAMTPRGASFFEVTGNAFGQAVSLRASTAVQVKKTLAAGGDDYTAQDIVNLGTQALGIIPWTEVSTDIGAERPVVGNPYFYKTATYVGVINAP
jgi:hypothetical protein